MSEKKVLEVEKNHTIFLTDIKCGKYDDGEAIHWTAGEILKGRRNGNVLRYTRLIRARIRLRQS